MQTEVHMTHLARAPDRTITTYEDRPEPLFVGDQVSILFSQVSPAGPDLRGTVTEVLRGERYRVEIVGDDGATYAYSAPRDLLLLVRRADA